MPETRKPIQQRLADVIQVDPFSGHAVFSGTVDSYEEERASIETVQRKVYTIEREQ